MPKCINKINTFFAKHCLSLIKKSDERNAPNIQISVENLDKDKNQVKLQNNKPKESNIMEIKNNEIESLFNKQFVRKKKSNSFRSDFIHRTAQSMKNKRKEIKCSDYGRLMVLFTTNLIICNQMIEAVKVIQEHGFEFKHDKMSYANMLKLYCIVHLKEKAYDSSVRQIDKAIVGFTKIGSASGLSLCYLLKAYLSLDNIEESISWSRSETPNNSKENTESKRCIEIFDQCILKSGYLDQKTQAIKTLRDKIMQYIQDSKDFDRDENIMQGDFKKRLILEMIHPILSLDNDSPIPKLGFDKKRKTITQNLKTNSSSILPNNSKIKPEK